MLVLQAVFLASLFSTGIAAPTLHYQVESLEEVIERSPPGCCYNNKLIKLGSKGCADERTTLLCENDNGTPRLTVEDGLKCSAETKEEEKGNEHGCAPTNCLYKGKSVKLGSVIKKELKGNNYKIVLCLKNGAVDTLSGECIDKENGGKKDICEKFHEMESKLMEKINKEISKV